MARKTENQRLTEENAHLRRVLADSHGLDRLADPDFLGFVLNKTGTRWRAYDIECPEEGSIPFGRTFKPAGRRDTEGGR